MEPMTWPGSLDVLGSIRKYVRQAAEEAGVDKKRISRLQLAVDEIATNIILYGYQRAGRTGNITARVETTPDTLTITLVDTAIPFNPFSRPAPDLSLAIEDRSVGGLGILLAQKNTDDYRYRFENGQNHNIFVVKIQPEPPAS